MRARVERWITSQWRDRSLLYHALQPLAGWVAREADRRRAGRAARTASDLRAPVIVVGNLVVGGAGKTPVTIALVEALRARGRHPGVVSRGFGSRPAGSPRRVDASSDPVEVGDEPVLIAVRTSAPVSVGVARGQAARALLDAERQVDVVVSDDGLQHAGLPRDLELVLWDSRGAGNGAVLPAGPLRERMSRPRDADLFVGCKVDPRFVGVDATGNAARSWSIAIQPRAACSLDDWAVRGSAAAPVTLAGRSVSAFAGIGDPEKFFVMLERSGAIVDRHPLGDHASFDARSFAGARHRLIVMTEKDAIKCARIDRLRTDARLHVLPIDALLPAELIDFVLERLDGLEAA